MKQSLTLFLNPSSSNQTAKNLNNSKVAAGALLASATSLPYGKNNKEIVVSNAEVTHNQTIDKRISTELPEGATGKKGDDIVIDGILLEGFAPTFAVADVDSEYHQVSKMQEASLTAAG